MMSNQYFCEICGQEIFPGHTFLRDKETGTMICYDPECISDYVMTNKLLTQNTVPISGVNNINNKYDKRVII